MKREIENAEKELNKLQIRIRDALATSRLASDWAKKGKTLEETIEEAERLYPYELNSQKPLTELMQSIPPEVRAWELHTGNARRVEDIWQPSRGLLREYIAALKKLIQ